jgi:hypothetical protein
MTPAHASPLAGVARHDRPKCSDTVSDELVALIDRWKEICALKDAQGDVVDAMEEDPQKPQGLLTLGEVVKRPGGYAWALTDFDLSVPYTPEIGLRIRKAANRYVSWLTDLQNDRRRSVLRAYCKRLDAIHRERSEKFKAWRASIGFDEADAKLDDLYRAKWKMEDEIAEYPCQSAADAAAKARFLFMVKQDCDECEDLMYKIMQSLLSLSPQQMSSQ